MTRLLVNLRRFAAYRWVLDRFAASALLRLVLVGAIPLLWIAIANVAPLYQMLVISFYEKFPLPDGQSPILTLGHYGEFFARPFYLEAFIRSFVFASLATLLTLIVVFPVAYFISIVASPNRRTRLLLLVIAPFWVSEVIRGFAWIIMLANRGAMNSFFEALGLPGTPYELLYTSVSLTIGVVYLTSLYMLLPLYSALEKIDRNLLEAAANLGASGRFRLTRIVLPLAREGIIAGCTLVFLLIIGLYAMPQLLGGPSNTLFSATIGNIFAKAGASWPLGSAFSIILTGSALIYVGIFIVVLQHMAGRRAP